MVAFGGKLLLAMYGSHWGHLGCPLSGGCPFFGGSTIGGCNTLYIKHVMSHYMKWNANSNSGM